jgi:hypothetical protein
MKSRGHTKPQFNGAAPYFWSTGQCCQCATGAFVRFFRFGVLLFVLGTLPVPRVMAVSLNTIVPGQLLISEIMANPAGDDSVQEWFEVFNPLPVAVDLNGLVVTSNNGSFTVGPGAAVSSDGYFLFARSSDPASNGGLPSVDFSWGQALTLTNSGGQLA